MAEKEYTQGAELEGRSAVDHPPGGGTHENRLPEARPVDYAFWQAPGTPFKVIYSLSLFHEIDFVVNEGYRKIPHGGIEEGGLLFGTIEEDCVRIEAYRSIACEHVLGPSFVLSEHDLANLELQLMGAANEAELRKYEPVGWFLAHTRGPLSLTEAEVAQFDRLFPQAHKLTVLVKPERFQPTRFGFLVRDANRQMARDGTPTAIILPLPGRVSKQGQSLIPSIPAPAPSVNARRLAESADGGGAPEFVEPPPRRRDRPKPVAMDEISLQSIWKIPPEQDELSEEQPEERIDKPAKKASAKLSDEALWRAEQGLEEEEPAQETDAQRTARKHVARERARVIEQSFGAPMQPERPQPRPIPIPRPLPESPVTPELYQQIEEFKTKSSEPLVNGRALSVLAVAALLGCIVGYVGYLQLPAPIIPLEVRGHAQSITVTWPAEETRHAVYASVRVNSGSPVALSMEEKTLGQVELNASSDVKVEVTARNWMRDSHGIVRYLRTTSRRGGVPE